MALKVTSGAWETANDENRNQRNAKRKEFFAAAGVAPAPSLRDIHVSGAERLTRMLELFQAAGGSRIEDVNLRDIASWAQSQIAASGLAAPAVMPAAERRSLGIVSYSPEVLRAFFSIEHLTSLDVSAVE